MSQIFSNCLQKTFNNLESKEEEKKPAENVLYRSPTPMNNIKGMHTSMSDRNEQLKTKLVQSMQTIEQLENKERLLHNENVVLRDKLMALWQIKQTESVRLKNKISHLENLLQDKNIQITQLWNVIHRHNYGSDFLHGQVGGGENSDTHIESEPYTFQVYRGNEERQIDSSIPEDCHNELDRGFASEGTRTQVGHEREEKYGIDDKFNERVGWMTKNVTDFQEKRDSWGSSAGNHGSVAEVSAQRMESFEDC